MSKEKQQQQPQRQRSARHTHTHTHTRARALICTVSPTLLPPPSSSRSPRRGRALSPALPRLAPSAPQPPKTHALTPSRPLAPRPLSKARGDYSRDRARLRQQAVHAWCHRLGHRRRRYIRLLARQGQVQVEWPRAAGREAARNTRRVHMADGHTSVRLESCARVDVAPLCDVLPPPVDAARHSLV